MITFLIRRLLITVVMLFLISVISFFIIVRTPGGPGSFTDMNPNISKAVRENFRKQFHLDEPIWQQYWANMSGLFSGDLRSLKDGRPVLERIGERLPNTLALNIASIVLALSFGLLIGVYSSRVPHTWQDTSLSTMCFALLAIPEFWISYLTIIALTNWLAVPILGTASYGVVFSSGIMFWLDRAWHLLLPAIMLGLGSIAAQSRYIRASMLETLREDYIRTARAKGLDKDTVFYKHALRNSIRPLITGIGGLLPQLIGGSVIIEMIFAYPGIGLLGYQAVLERDYPTLVALNFITAALVLLGNLISDVLYAVVDPRVRLE